MMKKRHIQKKKLLLYCINELPKKETKRIKSHLKSCDRCRSLYESEAHLIQLFKQYPKSEATELLLDQCREHFQKIRQRQSQQPRSIPILPRLTDRLLAPVPIIQIAAAALLFVTGVFMGRFLFPPPEWRSSPSKEMLRALQSGSTIENIQIIPSAYQKDKVEIQYRIREKKTFRGSIQNPEIQSALSYALMNASEDNIRLRSVGLLKEESREKKVQEALIHALRNDENPGVRLKAIRILKHLPISNKIKDIFLYVLLKDTNSGIRFEAAKVLAQKRDPSIDSVLRNQADKEQFIRALLAKNQDAFPISRAQ